MTSTVSSAKFNTSSSPSRTPLLPRTFTANFTTKKQILRHKASFILGTDSTDDPLSPHGSIYDAQIYGASGFPASEDNDTLERASLPAPESSSPRVIDENVREGETRVPPLNIPEMVLPERVLQNLNLSDTVPPDLVIPDTEFRYGNGTALDTIAEQKSSTTMRSLARARSADNIAKVIHLTHVDSFELPKVPRRMQSLSLDELTLIKRSHHDAINTIESKKVSPAGSAHEIYARPMSPIHAPVVRPSTPPGMPSWTAAQEDFQLQRTPTQHRSILDRFLGRSHNYSSRISASRLPSSSPCGPLSRPAPRFRPPRSSYAAIDHHPFTRAPVALVPVQTGFRSTGKRRLAQKVRFTPSATARNSEMNVRRSAIQSTSGMAIGPVAPMVAIAETLPPTISPHRSGRQKLLRALNSSLYNRTSHSANHTCRAIELPQATEAEGSFFSSLMNQAGSPDSTHSLRSAHLSIEPLVVAQGTAGSALSNTSTDCLMSGGIPDAHPHSKPRWCWKCNVDKAVVKMDNWLYNFTACMCFVCCGFDIDEDRHEFSTRSGTIPSAGFRYLDGAADYNLLPPTRVILDQTTAVVL